MAIRSYTHDAIIGMGANVMIAYATQKADWHPQGMSKAIGIAGMFFLGSHSASNFVFNSSPARHYISMAAKVMTSGAKQYDINQNEKRLESVVRAVTGCLAAFGGSLWVFSQTSARAVGAFCIIPTALLFLDSLLKDRDEPVDATHCVIKSNIEEGDIQSRIHRAQVVILLETHNNQRIEHLNGCVVRQHKGSHDSVLFEGSSFPEYLDSSLRRNARSWDLKDSPELEAILDRRATLIRLGSHDFRICLALAIYHRDTNEGEVVQNTEQDMLETFKDFYPENGKAQFESYQALDLIDRVGRLKEMAKECSRKIKAIEEKYSACVIKGFFDRNVSLAENIQKEVKSHSKVWVIAGEGHGSHISSHEKCITGVDHLYSSLETEKIHYLTLKCFGQDLDADDYSSPELEHQVHKESSANTIRENKVHNLRRDFRGKTELGDRS